MFKKIGNKIFNMNRVNYFTTWIKTYNDITFYTIGVKLDNGSFEVIRQYNSEEEMNEGLESLNDSLQKYLK